MSALNPESRYSFSSVPPWETARRKIVGQSWAREIFAALREDFSRWKPALRIPSPDTPTQRYHTYFCHADGEKLKFDPNSPGAHACPRCGRVYEGNPWDGAWAMQMHAAAAAQLERALMLIKLGDERDADDGRAAFEQIAFYYAERYPSYLLHGDDPGCRGRVQPHRLNEAVWVNAVLRVVRWSGLSDGWPESVRAGLDEMARLTVELLRPQVNAIHNHHTWMLAALAECAVRLGDGELLAWCRDSEFGMDAQVGRGFFGDGFWYEASTTYHYYTLESVLAYLDAIGPGGLSGEVWRPKLIRALNNPPRLAYADGRMPAYADGWLETFLPQFGHVAETAWGLVSDDITVASYYRGERSGVVRAINGGPPPKLDDALVSHRASIAALLYGPETVAEVPRESARSVVMTDAGIALLRSERVRLALRFGPDGGWHDHRDKLNVDVETTNGWRSLDLGTSGYGSDFTRWLRSPYAHNLLIVDGASQPRHAGRLLAASEDRIVAESVTEDARVTRSLQLDTDGWRDEYAAKLTEPRRLEWVFHGDGDFVSDDVTRPAEITGGDGLAWFENVREIDCGAVLRGHWENGATKVSIAVGVPTGFKAYCALAPGNAEGRPLGVVLLRGVTDQVTISAHFSIPA